MFLSTCLSLNFQGVLLCSLWLEGFYEDTLGGQSVLGNYDLLIKIVMGIYIVLFCVALKFATNTDFYYKFCGKSMFDWLDLTR